MIRLLARVALVLLLVWGGLAMLQDWFLYPARPASLPEVLAAAGERGLAPWPDAAEYRGLLREPEGTARATLVLLHGNAGHAGHRVDYAEILSRLGLRTLLAEYPGYGPRSGRLGEAALVADAVETVQRARRQFSGPSCWRGNPWAPGWPPPPPPPCPATSPGCC